MKWSKKLANYAQERSDKCDMGFRFSNSCDAAYYTALGGYSTSKEYDIADFLDSMYKEREHYDAYNNRCKSDGACTFFKHLSRDTLAEFGCAATKCEALTMRDGSIVNNAVTTVCYLAHGMDLHHVPSDRDVPYFSSRSVCSKCNDLIKGSHTCVNGLYEDNFPLGSFVQCNDAMECPFGLFNKETCKCECNKGFFGHKCEFPCKCVNTMSDCSNFSGFCNNSDYTNETRKYCSAECPRVCKVIKPAPGLKSCNKCPYGFFNEKHCRCECNKGFFGDKCEYPCKCVNTIKRCSNYSGFCDNKQYTSMTRKYCSAECPRVCKVIKPAPGLSSCQE